MTSPLDDVVLRPMSGPGVIARFGGVFLVVADESGDGAEPMLADLVEICRKVAAAKLDGRVLVRRLAGLIAGADTDPPALCAVSPHGADLIVFVHGDAEVVVRLRGGEQRISGRESAAWVDRLVAWPADELVVTVPGAQQVAAGGLLDLRAGVVPGAGFCLGAVAVESPPAALATDEAAPALEPLPVLEAEVAEPPAPPTTEIAKQSAAEPPSLEALLQASLAGAAVHAVGMRTEALAPADVPFLADSVTVSGIFCNRGHFNSPDGAFCGVCGIGLVAQSRDVVQGARPPLGVLVLDDGLTYVLDDDYVMGREPGYDPDVREGRARPLAIEDHDGGISRAHAEVRLRGWEVLVCDKGSVNGTYIAPPGESVWTPLTPFEPVAIVPGTRVQVGRRTFVYDSQHPG